MKRGPYKGREEEYKEARRLRRIKKLPITKIGDKLGVPWRTIAKWVEDIDVDRQEVWESSFPISEMRNRGQIRSRLLKKRGWRCEFCGREKWNGLPVPLEVHRQAEKSYADCAEEDLVLVCPNCHAQTPDYKNRWKDGE